ncbi:hypothetical protein [Nocardia jinanensis]|uniref:Uncharacterized protein n=1 Tax=Nocardia jinanensis TaxID=382504 RepID=A0A917RFD5_9NOCA|nr:hypothetical protein [Nocardia jinanensis]GGL05784.1 hypothetical protein GCM10011588_20300 [Nocardia jinanensis]
MEPVTMAVAAVAAGAAAGLTGAAEQAVTDAYQAVKRLIGGRYQSVDVEIVERQPESNNRRAVLAEELEQAGAGDDEELLVAARRVLVAVHRHAPQAAAVVGVRLQEVRAGELTITDITSTGSGVVAEGMSVDGSFTISGIRAGSEQPLHPPRAQQ